MSGRVTRPPFIDLGLLSPGLNLLPNQLTIKSLTLELVRVGP